MILLFPLSQRVALAQINRRDSGLSLVSRCPRLIATLLAAVCLLSPGAAVATPEDDKALLIALQRDQLSGLTEILCTRLVKQPTPDNELLGSAALELARIRDQRSMRLTNAESRGKLWNESDVALAAILKQHGNLPIAQVIRFDWAALLINRATFLEQLSRVADDTDKASLTALSLVQAKLAVDLLTEMSKRTEAELDTVDSGKRATELERSMLQSHYLLSKAYLAAAKVETENAPRQYDLTHAFEELEDYTRRLEPLPVFLESHLAVAEIQRLRDQPGLSVELLKRFDDLKDEQIRNRYLARRNVIMAEAYRDLGRLDAALALFENAPASVQRGAEGDLVYFEILLRLGLALQATSPDESEELQQRALAVLDQLEGDYGTYWGKRGEQLLAQYGSLDQEAGNVTLLFRLANVLRARKQWDAALQTYLRALSLAERQNDKATAIKLAFASAGTALDAERYVAAADQLQTLLQKYPQHELAPRASFTAALALGRALAKTPADKSLSGRYQQALTQHLQKFPKDTSIPQTHALLGNHYEQLRQVDAAITHYRQVPPGSESFPRSLETLAGLVHDRLQSSKSSPSKEDLAAVSAYFRRVLSEGESQLSESDEGQKAKVVAEYVLARLLAEPSQGKENEAIELLADSVLADPESVPVAIRTRAWVLLIRLYGKNQQTDQAVAAIRTGIQNASGLIPILAEIDPLEEDLPTDERKSRGAIVKAAAERVLSQPDFDPQRNPAEHLSVRIRLAEAEAATGNQSGAARRFRQLHAEAVDDPRPIRGLAQSLEAEGNDREAYRYWNDLRTHTREGSADWFSALYHCIKCQAAIGRKDQAERWYYQTETLYPELGGTEQKARFEALREQANLKIPPAEAAAEEKLP